MIKRSENFVRKELMDKLIANGRRSGNWEVSLKIVFWELTVFSSLFLKRFFDTCVALIMLFFLSPIFIFTAIAIYLESPGSVFFKQVRVGKNGRHFDFYKFRSMVMNADRMKDEILKENESEGGVTFKMKKDPRITHIGSFIRKFSIDELPQLFNVLKGDMSLVGPRPPVPREVAEYTLHDRKRLHVMPGITCIWQISGRSDIPFKEQVELDKQYIKSKSIWRDILILIKTVPAVLTGKGAY